jgi:hypothetical protein
VNQTKFRVGGYAKLDAIFDFEDAGDRFQFQPSSIPVGNQQGEQLTFHARQTRLNIEAKTPTSHGELLTFVEGDFFRDGNTFRLRHAYGEWGRLLAGQTWTLFVDADAIPETLDFNGPDGALLTRRAQIRWTETREDWCTWAAELHEPNPTIQTSIPGETRNRVPLLVSSLRLQHASGHLYLAGGVGAIRFVPTVGPPQDAAVWGAVVSARQRIGSDHLIAQLGVGEGNEDFLPPYLEGRSGVSTSTTQLDALRTVGWVVAYQHVWNDFLRSNVSYRTGTQQNVAAQPDDAFRRNQYFVVDLICSPLEDRLVDVGVEYLWGFRENKNADSADAHRVQVSVIFRLP